jgi:hypothetical protein
MTRWLPPALAAIVAAGWVAGFPVEPTLVGIGLLAAAALIAWRPILLFVIVPAALPVLDLAPWSGRRGWDEFDMLVLVGLTVAWARVPRPLRVPATPGTVLALVLLLLGLAVSTARALWPWSTPDLDAFGNPLSPFNALRLDKAAVWAVGLWLLARRLRAAGADPVRAFGTGLVVGLTCTVLWILAERLAFSFLLDFSSDYRIAGPFSAMSLGGAYVECFLAVATPFLLARLLPPLSTLRLVAGAVLLAGASYALMVTYSRGGYLAMAVGVVVLGVASHQPGGPKGQRALVAIALLAVAGAVAYPILQGSFAQSRLQTVAADLQTRERHWTDSLQAMDDGAAATLFGMGLGRYAAINFWQNPAQVRTGGHRLIPAADVGAVLRLGVGYAYFVEQIVPVQPGARYRLRYDVRSDGAGASLWVGLCQKWIMASFDCAEGMPAARERDRAPPTAGAWRSVALTLVAPDAGPGRLPRPMRLSLNNQGSTAVEVKNVSLIGEDGIDLVRNGGFEAGFDRWTFTSDNHLAWHTKSMPLGIYFEQGLLGLLGFAALLLAGISHAARGARRGRADGAALLAALCAFVTVGAIDTLVDAPRFLMLWLLLCLLPSALAISAAAPARAAP